MNSVTIVYYFNQESNDASIDIQQKKIKMKKRVPVSVIISQNSKFDFSPVGLHHPKEISRNNLVRI